MNFSHQSKQKDIISKGKLQQKKNNPGVEAFKKSF